MPITLPLTLTGTDPPVMSIVPGWAQNEFQAAQYTLLVRQCNLLAIAVSELQKQNVALTKLVNSTCLNP